MLAAVVRVTTTSEAKLTVERSRFFALLAPAEAEADVKKLLARLRRKYKKANHHCWAARLPDDDGGVQELARDDGEVGRPGHKILELMRRHELEGVLVVSRIFGGVKLGPGGVGRAFRDVALLAIEALPG